MISKVVSERDVIVQVVSFYWSCYGSNCCFFRWFGIEEGKSFGCLVGWMGRLELS